MINNREMHPNDVWTKLFNEERFVLPEDQQEKISSLLKNYKLDIPDVFKKVNEHFTFKKLGDNPIFKITGGELDPKFFEELNKIELKPIQLQLGGFFQNTSTQVIITRPWCELFSHLRNLKLPTFELVARCITTLVMGIFRWHLCDRTMLVIDKDIIHSLKGKVVIINIESLQKKYPYMIENAFLLICNYKSDTEVDAAADQNHDLETYKEISPETIRDYFKILHKITITPKEKGNTIWDLFKSNSFNIYNAVTLIPAG